MASSKLAAVSVVVLALGVLAAEPADARRGGSFGSRGARTYYAPQPTRTAPAPTAPIQRSMTPATAAGQQPGARPAQPGWGGSAPAPQRRGGFFGGLGGGLIGGLLAGGLIGGLLGHGFGGGMGGFGSLFLQIALVGLAVWLLMKLFRRRQPAVAGGGPLPETRFQGFGAPFGGAGGEPAYSAPPAAEQPDVSIPLTSLDRQAFEQLLREVQDAFGREDYAGLRARTTPEVMSYLAEELSENATQGRRNEVRDLSLLEADVAEAWREGDHDYATAAMRYESIDVMRDRSTGAVLTGDSDRPTQTTEVWTFVRQAGAPWKVSAIQEA